jgi:hypothetical protein
MREGEMLDSDGLRMEVIYPADVEVRGSSTEIFCIDRSVRRNRWSIKVRNDNGDAPAAELTRIVEAILSLFDRDTGPIHFRPEEPGAAVPAGREEEQGWTG